MYQEDESLKHTTECKDFDFRLQKWKDQTKITIAVVKRLSSHDYLFIFAKYLNIVCK